MPTQPAILGPMRLGNFRLGYAPPALTALRRTTSRITIGGVAGGVREAGLTIHDAINDAPNTASFTKQGTPPVAGQEVRIAINSDTPRLLFNGTIQASDAVPHAWPTQLAYPCSAIDDLARLNERRPFGTWVDVSQTTVAQALIAGFAPGFSAAGVAADLPPISITFDGTETFSSCLKRVASGGYYFVEDRVLFLFQTLVTDAPDAIDGTPGRLLDDPPIRMTTDASQVRTRVYGKGHGEPVPAAILAGATIVPLADAVMFNPAGGQAIAGTIPDGAQSQRIAYTGVQLGGGGGLVGPGASPTAAPVVAVAAGAGVESGVHGYAVTFGTPAGESLPGPIAALLVGVFAAPATAPAPGLATAGGSVTVGSHTYVATFVTAAGETTPSPISGAVNTTSSTVTQAAPTVEPDGGAAGAGTLAAGDYRWAYTFVTAVGETTGSPDHFEEHGISASFIVTGIATGPAGVIARKLYRSIHGGSTLKLVATIANNTATTFDDGVADGALGATMPTVNTTGVTTTAMTVPLTGVPIGPTAVTARKIYRRFNGTGTFNLVTTIANNTTTTYTDTTANGSLGAAAPSTNTATANQGAITGVPIGATAVTSRRIYRTTAGGAALKLLATLADNTTTTYADSTADASLGAAAPVVDTSGLAQPEGQALAGETSLIVAGTGPFAATGGWAVIGNGAQVIRYTSTTGAALTGIPSSGPGAIVASIGYNSTVTAAPALTGVTGLTLPMQKGARVHVWVERNDLTAQADRIALDLAQGRVSDGVVEHTITDDRRGEASLIALCDADLALFSRPIVTVTYACHDVKTKSGKTIHLDRPDLGIGPLDLTIQSVDISEIDRYPGVPPRFSVTASNVRFSLDDLLRRALAGKAA